MIYPQHLTGIPYANDHRLQTLDICLPRPLRESDPKETIWIVFIHGGAWRDPTQQSQELEPALTQLLTNATSRGTLNRIAGFASLNYGLSTYAPKSVEGREDPALSVRHPRHVLDIRAALAFLQKTYGVGGSSQTSEPRENTYDWIAVGHSCGATLAFQICMSPSPDGSPSSPSGSIPVPRTSQPIAPPVAIIGLEGIYSLLHLHSSHIAEPFYKFFITAAFGPDQAVWEGVSPTNGNFEKAVREGGMRVVVLGHSEEDELVEGEQVGLMGGVLRRQGWEAEAAGEAEDKRDGEAADRADRESAGGGDGGKGEGEGGKTVIVLSLSGKHDEIWSLGIGVRTSIEVAIGRLFSE